MTVRDVLSAHGLKTQDEADELLVRLAQNAVKCAWCQQDIKAGDPALPVSHGICPTCKARVLGEAA